MNFLQNSAPPRPQKSRGERAGQTAKSSPPPGLTGAAHVAELPFGSRWGVPGIYSHWMGRRMQEH